MHRAFSRRSVFLALLALAGLAPACSTPPTREPETDYAEVRPLLYDYGLVFDCVAEMIQDEGFQVERADRDAGTLETKAIPGPEDLVHHTQPGRRIRARVVKTGPKDFIVRIAATKLERDVGTNTLGDWRYVGPDDQLMEKLKKRFDTEVEKRYKTRSDKG